jgi:hypothetical protein
MPNTLIADIILNVFHNSKLMKYILLMDLNVTIIVLYNICGHCGFCGHLSNRYIMGVGKGTVIESLNN